VLSYLVLQLDKNKPSHMQAVRGFAKKFEEATKVVADVLKIIPNTTLQYFKVLNGDDYLHYREGVISNYFFFLLLLLFLHRYFLFAK
jgi:hypothetical protein